MCMQDMATLTSGTSLQPGTKQWSRRIHCTDDCITGQGSIALMQHPAQVAFLNPFAPLYWPDWSNKMLWQSCIPVKAF